MIHVDLTRRSIGVNFINSGEAEVLVWSPKAEMIALQIQETNTNISLEKRCYGFWKATTKLIKPDALYQFVINGDKAYPDPASLYQPEGVHGPSQAIDLNQYQWNDSGWKNISLDKYIIYELHTGTFTEEASFAGIEKKLDYLKQLGITAIEIMPVAQFPGNRNWGYDGVYPFAVQNSYGGATALQHLVDVCHQKEIAVILDVVYNHLGPEGNYLATYGPYLTDKYKTPWGGAINFDDAWCDGVRNYVVENVLMWFRDFHIDALRLDAVHAIKDFSTKHILSEVKEYVAAYMKQTGKQHYLFIESDLNDTKFIDPIEKRGYGMDAQWIDEFHHALRVTATGEQSGYYSDFCGIEHFEKAYRDAYVYNGQFSEHRKKHFGEKTTNPGHQFIVFSQNHDQVGNRVLGERTSKLVSFEMQKLMAAAVMIAPYLPLLFMGEEWSEPNPFLYFVSLTDPHLAEAVRKGRREEFAAFHAEGEAPDPVAETSFQISKLQWHLVDEGQHRLMLQFYKAIIQLRKTHPALYTLNRQNLRVESDKEKKLLTVHRWHEEHHIVCLMNFLKTTQQPMPLPLEKDWHKILDSSEEKWSCSLDAPRFLNDIKAVLQTDHLRPESIQIYSNHV